MGGVWERIIRSVRKILRTLMREQLVSGEALRTLMAEVESILNSRPLTQNSESPADPEALTPNHLLLLRPNLNVSLGVFVKGDLYCQRRWKQVQYLTDVFWRRWLSEYLPLLARASKVVKALSQLCSWIPGAYCRRKSSPRSVAFGPHRRSSPRKRWIR